MNRESGVTAETAAALIASIPDAVVTINTDGEIRYVNEAFGDLLGYEPEEVIGEPVTTVIPSGIRGPHEHSFSRYVESGERHIDWSWIEFPALHAEGHEIPTSVSLAEVTVEGERLVTGIIRDISDRVEAEAALRRNEKLFRTLAEHVEAVVWVYDLREDAYVYASPEFETLWGRPQEYLYELDELSGMLETIHEDDRELMAERIQDTERLDENDRVGVEGENEYRVIRPDGDVRWVRDDPVVVEDAEGPARLVGVATDVTEYKTREARLEQHTEALREDNARLDEFASVVSHDLRNPLNVALGRLELAREDHPDDEHIDSALGALERIDRLVDGMLDAARAGRGTESFEQVSLAAVARDAWATADIDGRLAVDDDTVMADRVRLSQLFQNLFVNAAEHAADDDGPTVLVEPTETGFAVADDGPGIPPDERGSVFEMGYSGADGTGFGLAIVRRVAGVHGWKPRVEASSEGGARFVFEPS